MATRRQGIYEMKRALALEEPAMSAVAASLPGFLPRSRAALLSAMLPIAVAFSIAQAGALGTRLLGGTAPGFNLSDGGATEAPEPSCVGCHFETPGEDAAPGPGGQTAEAAHQRFTAAAGLREAGLAIRARQP